jgi:hypothetical protein
MMGQPSPPRSWRTYSRGILSITFILPATAALFSACSHPLAPTASGSPTTQVDALEFVIGDAGLWPRTGSQFQHQLVDRTRREVCWVKYGLPFMFECWRWDDEWIYHVVDHALDRDRVGESYVLTDGRWLPRMLVPGQVWTLDAPSNRIRWFLRDCSEAPPGLREGIPGTGLFPYRMSAWLEPARHLGGYLGTREVLVLAYAPYAPGRPPSDGERFLFGRGAGWYRWERDGNISTFADRGGVVVNRTASCLD